MDNPLPESVAGTSEPAQERVIYLYGGPRNSEVAFGGPPIFYLGGRYERTNEVADSEFGQIPMYEWVEG